MHKRLSLLAALTLVVGFISLFSAPAQAADKDCSDFDTQAQAQRFYLHHGGPQRDPHRLDADNDVKACDGLDTVARSGSTADAGGKRLRQRARVVEVDDGDTIKVRLIKSGAPRNVRLIGIDTPEVNGRVECGGPEASRSMKKMLQPGQVVRLVSDPQQDNRDLFNRLLRYVVKPGGKDVARKQLRRGWARVFIFGGDSFTRVKSYRRVKNDAKRAERGAWLDC